MAWLIMQGDARKIPLKNGSVQCIVTSPPYWGLRDYGIQPNVWGGDLECKHDFSGTIYHEHREQGSHGKSRTTDRFWGDDPSRRFDGNHQRHFTTQFCLHCDAWLGTLGLEPTPELYIEHLVEIFKEVRRVMRKDGIVFLNLGDSYYGGNKGNSGLLRPGDKQGTNLGSWSTRCRDSGPLSPTRQEFCSSLKPKDLCGIPWRVALALQADGWWLRSDIIWSKPNPMPESVRDRASCSHEYIFLFTKSARYFWDRGAVRENVTGNAHARGDGINPKASIVDLGNHHGKPKQNASFSGAVNKLVSCRNIRSVWEMNTQPFPKAHFATFPEELPLRCIKAGTSEKGCCVKCGNPWVRVIERTVLPPIDRKNNNALLGRDQGLDHDNPFPAGKTIGWKPSCRCGIEERKPCVVLDPFAGAGTTVLVADKLGRIGIGLDPKSDYCEIARKRVYEDAPLFNSLIKKGGKSL